MRKGIFITIEGPDGCGKTTQSLLLVKYLRSRGYNVVHTREPGGTSLAEFIRDVLLNKSAKIAPLTELLLYSAARAQHTLEKIIPALKRRKIIVCERYTDATVAYQGYGRGLNLDLIEKLNTIATGGLKPDLTLILDLPVKTGFSRIRKKRTRDRLENESYKFHTRVRKGYLQIALSEPERVKVIDATKSIPEVHSEIKGHFYLKVER